jgi:MATE family multidrug resistance protein
MSLLRLEARALWKLAWPLMLMRVGHVLMNAVDTLMAGGLGPVSLAAVGTGGLVFWFAWVFWTGLLNGAEPLLAQARGRGDQDGQLAMGTALRSLSLALLPLFLAFMAGGWWVLRQTQPAEIVTEAERYLEVLVWVAPLTLLNHALMIHVAADGETRLLARMIVGANAVNVAGNVLLTSGALGLPSFGVRGIAASTVLCQAFESLFLLHAISRRGSMPHLGIPWRSASWAVLARQASAMVRLGGPLAVTGVLEFAAFGAVALLLGPFGEVTVAGHYVALNVAGLSFCAALGISAAAGIRVGHAVGRRDGDAIRRVALAAWLLGGMVATVTASAMILFGEAIAWCYIRDPATIVMAAEFLVIAAVFQWADTTQVIGFGVLRGMGDTFWPATFNLVGYWLVGLPLGGWMSRELASPFPLWHGLVLGLFCVAAALVVRFLGRSAVVRDHLLETVQPGAQGLHLGAEGDADMLGEA